MDYEKKSLRTVKKSLWTRPAGRKEQEGALQVATISPSVLSAGCTFSGETPRKRTLGGYLGGQITVSSIRQVYLFRGNTMNHIIIV